MRSEKWLVNVYVVNDPVNPENNGKVKILRYGKQIHNIIMDAIEGEDAADLGPRIFDLGLTVLTLELKLRSKVIIQHMYHLSLQCHQQLTVLMIIICKVSMVVRLT